MSRIEKLEISGIRSFPHDRLAEIRFTPPLTLILGHNGCGKTTIIESLKYITTGEMPPGCGRGQSFVHDPKMAKEMAVKAQIKLRLKSAKGERIEFVRSMEVTQKMRTLEFKSLEQTISRVGPDGIKRGVSNKCIDFLHEIVSVIGVSKPILENVIFCHQEDSNWPLEENKKVKDKFDAIFNATKYIKCLAVMQKLRKEKKQEVKNMQEVLASLKDMKEEADKKKAELVDQQQVKSVILTEQEEYKEKKKPVLARLNEIAVVERHLADILSKLATQQNTIKLLERNNAEDMADQRHQFDCSDEELHRKIREYAATLELKKNDIRKVEENIRITDQELETLSSRSTIEQRKLARYEAEFEHHNSRLEQRRQGILAAVSSKDIPPLQAYIGKEDLSESESSDALGLIKDYISEQRQRHDDLLHRNKEEEHKLQKELDILRTAEAALSQEVKSVTARIGQLDVAVTRTDREVKQLQRELDNSNMEEVNNRMEQLHTDIEKQMATLDQQQSEERILTLQGERQQLTKQLTEAKQTLAQLNEQTEKRKELQMHQATVNDCTQKITQLYRTNKDVLDGLLPAKTSEETVKLDFDQYSEKLERDISQLRGQLQSLKDKRCTNQSTIDSLRRQEEEKEKEVKALEKHLSDHCPDMPLEDALQKKKEQVDQLQREVAESESIKTVLEGYVHKLTAEDRCPLCCRDFTGKEENVGLRTQLTSRIDKLPVRLETARNRLEKMTKKYNELQILGPIKQQLVEAQTKLRRIQAELVQPLSKVRELNSELEDIEMNLSVLEGDSKLCRSVQDDITNIDRLIAARRTTTSTCDVIKRQLGEHDSGVSVSSATASVSRLEQEQADVSSELEQLQADLNRHNTRLNNLRTEINKLEKQEIEVQRKQTALEQKQLDVQRSRQERSAEQEKRQLKVAELQPARQAVKEQQARLDTAKSTGAADCRSRESKLEQLRETERPLHQLHRTISKYLTSGDQRSLAITKEEVASLASQTKDKAKGRRRYTDKLQEQQQELANHNDYERSLTTEKKIRDKKRQIELLQVEVENLKRQVETSEQNSLAEEKSRLNSEFAHFDRKINSATGRLEEVDKQVRGLESSLRDPKYSMAVKKYHNKMIQIKCTDVACSDLNKYYKALDTAVMRFHGEKMKAINKSIRHLWISTYKGNDVDRIEIKTDESESKGADKRRSYNYRVVMYKNEAEMDMRGRCSAGQKVLASLIIRMALAETFSKNCGVLALDEPTTNLDRENIRALSDALVNIVNSRSSQRNFQLIVITHDHDFLQALANADDIRSYFNVYRDDHGMSAIQKMNTSGTFR